MNIKVVVQLLLLSLWQRVSEIVGSIMEYFPQNIHVKELDWNNLGWDCLSRSALIQMLFFTKGIERE